MEKAASAFPAARALYAAQSQAGPFVDIGTPHLASGEVARRVLSTLQDASAAFGTEIRIVGDVGIVAVGR